MIDGTATLRGLTTGSGTDYLWPDWPTGLLSTASIRVDDMPIPLRSGVIPGDDYTAGRDVAIPVMMIGEMATIEPLLAALGAAFAPGPVDEWLDVRVAGSPAEYSLRGRPRGIEVAMSRTNVRSTGVGRVDALCRFTATDPVRYSAVEESVTLTLGSPGESYLPFELPVFLGQGGSSGEATAVNVGSASVSWTATLNGPLTNPRLTHVGSGAFIGVQASIDVGETVVVDGVNLLLGGVAPRPSWLRPGSSPFLLAPGSNVLRLSADAGSGDASVTWRSGWS